MDPRGSARDRDIGLDGFLTTTPALGGRLKVRVDDFRVDEIGGLPPEDPGGPYTVAIVRLTNWETNKFVQAASDRLQMSRKRIRFSGTKDKRGITTQVFTMEAPLDAVQDLGRLPGVDVERAYRTRSESSLGDHTDNSFDILLRDVAFAPDTALKIVEETRHQAEAALGFPNVFGPQRFGAMRATTHRVGERILHGDFKGAVHTYLGGALPGLAGDVSTAWDAALAVDDYAGLLRLAQADQGFERTLLHRLVERPGEYVDALLGFPKNLQLLFVYAYQSFLFNQIITERLRAGLPLGRAVEGDLIAPVDAGVMKEEWVPVRALNATRINQEIEKGRAVVTGLLPGTEAPQSTGRPGECETMVLAGAQATRSTFVVPEHVEWSSRGTRRALTIRPQAFRAEAAPDDLHPGRSLVRFRFSLPRGAYATSVLREFVKSDRLVDYA